MSSSSMWKNNTGVRVTKENIAQVREDTALLASVEILVGFPEDTTEREADPLDDPEKRGMTNAALAYIHDQGAPERNIPQREFMRPAIDAAQDRIERGLSGALRVAMRGKGPVAVEQALHAVGLAAQLAVMNKITEGIPPPLAEATLRARARKGKGSLIAKAAQIELARRERGDGATTTIAKPLIETGQLRNAVKYVIRARNKRRR